MSKIGVSNESSYNKNKITNMNYNINNDLNLIKEENEYLSFKKKIMSDNTIDNQMKSILLQYRREYLDSLRKKLIDKEISITLELKVFMQEYEKKMYNIKNLSKS